ncbi:hypothetical protein A3Q56_03631 [Intoshia linei]|uniref:Palmitoyltransferase n=1 Tax=Intoshia linei TaxID=1819745 RepID=A0A177B2W3_9BILA|nr:hypothetical protein A3Q56_03631 [Intoshia linei]
MFICDGIGLLCFVMTYAALGYAEYVVLIVILWKHYPNSWIFVINSVLYSILAIFATVSHIRSVTSNPGYIDLRPTHSPPEGKDWSCCNYCTVHRPPSAHHCRVCKRCVLRMDHHCPWINNCVGMYNQRFFIQFLFYIGCLSIYSLILISSTWSKIGTNDAFTMIHYVILIIESLLFGSFILAIGFDQFSAVRYSTTYIDRLQGNIGVRQSTCQALESVFGTPSKMLWLIPCALKPINHNY